MSINVNGTDYSLTDGDYDLSAMFHKQMSEQGAFPKEKFTKNVVAYHETEAFRTFVQNAYNQEVDGGPDSPQLFLVTFGGPEAIQSVLGNSRKAGIKGARAGQQRKSRAWQTNFAEAMTGIGWSAMEDYYNTNKEELFSKCGIPNESRTDDFVTMLINTGRGTLGCRVAQWKGVSSKSGVDGTFPINLGFRLDANNKGRSKATKSNGVSTDAAAAAPAK